MKLHHHQAWLIAGSAAVAMFGLASIPHAHAQAPQDFRTDVQRPAISPFSTDPVGVDAFRTTVTPERRPPETDQDGTVADTPLQPSFGRPAIIDGLLPPDSTEVQTVDGVLTAPEPENPIDGLDPDRDTRTAEEAAPFELPRDGDDRSAFILSNAPEPEPARDRRTQRITRLEPYDPVGIRFGSFLLFPEADISLATFNNVFRQPTDRKGDLALEVNPTVRALSDWNVHAMELAARGVSSFHADYPSEDDRAWGVEARGRLDITRRTNLQAFASHDVTQESRGSVNSAASTGNRPDVVTDRVGATLNHRFNRLSLQLRGALTDYSVGPTTDDTGATVSNTDRAYTRHEAALRATWEFKPTLSVFGEVGLDDRSFAVASRSDGISRSSEGERYRLGVAFGSTSQIVRGEVSLGSATQEFDDARLPTLDGIIIDANLGWRVTALTSLLFTAQTDVGDSTVPGSGGTLNRTAGVELRHAFRRHLVASAGLTYRRADYKGVELVEEDLTTSLGIEYFANREITLFGRYAHVDFETTTPAGNYTADELRVGLRLRR